MTKYYSIGETAQIADVTIRTLRYYDKIGLLKPAKISDSGYRFYTQKEISVLLQIVFYRELEFSIEQIRSILSSPENDRSETLKKHRELLELKKAHIEELIRITDETIKGEVNMRKPEITAQDIELTREKYAQEVLEKYQNSKEFAQSEEKRSKQSKAQREQIAERQDEIFCRFADLAKSEAGCSENEAQQAVKDWHEFINENYYDCSAEVLAGLGKLYVADERFKENLDRYGEGTADFMSRAIEDYYRKNKA